MWVLHIWGYIYIFHLYDKKDVSYIVQIIPYQNHHVLHLANHFRHHQKGTLLLKKIHI